ncbi:hypothetical protein JX266_003855 [Neoarthrinium moseri]|nr:hypothetical protein JX266_003855 [Neoarthrinium moseri]
MDSFAKLKRRTTDLMDSASKNMPSASKVQMPNFSFPSFTKSSSGPSMKATWQHISIPPLPRSSHSLNVVAGSAYVFGGEVEPRQPVDNDMHIINLPISGAPADYYSVKAKASTKTQLAKTAPIPEEGDLATPTEPTEPLDEVPLSSPPAVTEPESADKGKSAESSTSPSSADVPSPRVGHATAVIGTRIFLFGGRTAAAETLDEAGRVWIFETKTHTWSYLDPSKDSLIPPPRSYFAAVATEKPRDFAIKPVRRTESWKEWAEGDSAEVGIPQRPIAGSVAATATDEEESGFGTFIIHGGCLADGSRTNDVFAFDVRSRIWKQLPTAPGAPRGGPALALAKSRLYRFGGYDGTAEIGGQLDVLELGLDQFDDRVSRGEVGVFARGDWTTLAPATSSEQASEKGSLVAEEWPGARSVTGMHLVLAGGGREYLVVVLGEQTPSGGGHEAAGTFWSDAWAFQVPPVGMTPASFTDAMLQAVGRKTGEGKWTRLATGPYDDEVDADVAGPGARGWFASSSAGDYEEGGVVLFGGIDQENRRLGDGWVLRLA